MHLQVPTQYDILSNDQHGRWHEIDTYVPVRLRLVSPAAPALCLGFRNYPQDYPPLSLLLSYHILQSSLDFKRL